MKGRNVVVTGGAGFIGSNLARVLVRRNEVIVIDDLSTGHQENIQDLIDDQSIAFVKGDITNLNFFKLSIMFFMRLQSLLFLGV